MFCGIEALKFARAHGISEKTVMTVAAQGTGNSWYVWTGRKGRPPAA
jgi:3-hydroxyisobutyrate dehydrogenase-like beta-hydroxyacid dehydrogenase